MQWMMATHFKLTLLAHVHFPPHKPYIVATFTHNMNFKTVRTMANGEPRMQHCKSSHLSKHVSLRLHTMQSQPKLRSCQRGQHLCITCLGNMRGAHRTIEGCITQFNSVINLQLYNGDMQVCKRLQSQCFALCIPLVNSV